MMASCLARGQRNSRKQHASLQSNITMEQHLPEEIAFLNQRYMYNYPCKLLLGQAPAIGALTVWLTTKGHNRRLPHPAQSLCHQRHDLEHRLPNLPHCNGAMEQSPQVRTSNPSLHHIKRQPQCPPEPSPIPPLCTNAIRLSLPVSRSCLKMTHDMPDPQQDGPARTFPGPVVVLAAPWAPNAAARAPSPTLQCPPPACRP